MTKHESERTMHVGILSMQRVENFGSFLQAYGLKELLQTLGHSVCFVDIRPGEFIQTSEQKSHRDIFQALRKRIGRRPIQLMQYNRYLKARTRKFETEWFPLIGIQDPVDESSCDAVVVGSDEVFNISPDAKWGVSYQLFGDVHCDCTISYAGSFANTTYEDLCALNIEKRIAAAMNKFKAISTRDSASEQNARILTNRDVSIHLDPVLVGDFNAIVPNSIPYKDYILVYSYDNRIHETSEVKAIKRFAKRYNKKLISFGFYQNWCDKNILVDPFTLMACFRNASYVVTDTFHGTVLSIKHNRPFTAFIRDSNRNKITDLVTRLHLENRVLVAPQELKSVLESNIDYDSVNKRLAMERKRSLEYLYRNLG